MTKYRVITTLTLTDEFIDEESTSLEEAKALADEWVRDQLFMTEFNTRDIDIDITEVTDETPGNI